MQSIWFKQLVLLLILPLLCIGSELARGFNDNIDWLGIEDGENVAEKENKPMLILIHKSWCGACKALKSKFPDAKEIEQLSKHFVMVNIMDDEEPQDKKYAPDGGYIPRILFADHDGIIQTDIINEQGSASYKYFYPVPDQITASMKKAYQKITGNSLPEARDEL